LSWPARVSLTARATITPPKPYVRQAFRKFLECGIFAHGFSIDAGVRIEPHDRAALERLVRYCARPPFAMERLRKEGAALVYRCAKHHSEPSSDKRGARVDELHLPPLELIERIAALVPPPRPNLHHPNVHRRTTCRQC
jgi:hypothetical protein